MEATKPISETPINPVDIEGSNESKNVVENAIKNAVKIDQSTKTSEESDSQSRWGKLGNNSKLC